MYCTHSNPAGAFRPVRPRELRLIPRGAPPRSGLTTLCVSPTTRWGLLYYSVPAAALTDDRIEQLQCGKCSKRSQAGKVTFRLIQAVILAERSRQERENRRDAHGSGDQMLPPDAVRQPQRVHWRVYQLRADSPVWETHPFFWGARRPCLASKPSALRKVDSDQVGTVNQPGRREQSWGAVARPVLPSRRGTNGPALEHCGRPISTLPPS